MAIEKLYEQKKKIEAISKQKILTPEQIMFYGELCKRICSMERLKFLSDTAPKTMDPKKIKGHWTAVKKTINEVEPKPQEELKELLKKAGSTFNEYKATSVQSYNKMLQSFIKQFVVLWNKQNNYK